MMTAPMATLGEDIFGGWRISLSRKLKQQQKKKYQGLFL
jgi:hypothetical protein